MRKITDPYEHVWHTKVATKLINRKRHEMMSHNKKKLSLIFCSPSKSKIVAKLQKPVLKILISNMCVFVLIMLPKIIS